MNSADIYQLSFTIAPGELLGCSEPRALFVGRVQGVKERFEQIRRATKLCRDITPPHLLLAAAQGIASELDVALVVGVPNEEQPSKMQVGGFPFPFDYDTFWKDCSATLSPRKFYVLPAEFGGKPLDQISADHRRRARHKRQFRTMINESVRLAFAEKCLKSLSERVRAQP